MQSVPKLLSNLQSLSLLQPARADLGPGHLPLVNAGSLPGASVTLCLPYRDDTKRKKKKKKKLLNSLFSNSLPAPEASPRFRGQGAAGGGRGAPGPPPPPRTGAALVSGFSRRQQVAASGRARCVPGAGGWGAVPVSGPRQACGGGGWGRRRRVRSGWRVGRGCLLVVGLLESDWLLGIPCLIGGVTSSSSSPSVS